MTHEHKFLRHLIDSLTTDLATALKSFDDKSLASMRHHLFASTVTLVDYQSHLVAHDKFPPEERRPYDHIGSELESFFSRTDADILYSKELL